MYQTKIKANSMLLKKPKKNEIFLKSKIVSAEFYNLHILPRVLTHFEIVQKGGSLVKLTSDSNI